jgi:integrase
MSKRARGTGSVYQRGDICWISYSRNGHQIRESAETTDERKAWKLLQQRLEEKKKPTFVGPSEKKLTLDDLEAAIKADYVRQERRSWETVEYCLKPLKEYFEFDTLLQIGARIEEYQDHRLKQGMARATINRECAYLRRGYKLLLQAKPRKISELPVIKMLEGENIREGFVNVADFEAALPRIKDDDTRDIVQFLYNCAWRSGEAKSLEWDKIDLHDWVIRLARKNSKNKKPRTLVLVGELKDIIVRRLAKRLPDCKLVFHREGKEIKSFAKAFKGACKRVGVEGVVPHDMRRSGVRNLRRAGNDEHDCMEISGHKTRAVFDRYDITDEDDQRRSLERQQEYKRQQMEQGRKVVPIRQAG